MHHNVTDKSRAGDILRFVADFIDRLSDRDVDMLLGGTAFLTVSGEGSPRHRQRARFKLVDPGPLILELKAARTRDEASAILEKEGVSKGTLEMLARQLDLPVLRSDSVGRLRQKIVESTVGYKINSDAIQGRSRGRS